MCADQLREGESHVIGQPPLPGVFPVPLLARTLSWETLAQWCWAVLAKPARYTLLKGKKEKNLPCLYESLDLI